VGELKNNHRQCAKILFVSRIRSADTEKNAKNCQKQTTCFSWRLGVLAVNPFVFSMKGLV
jgi:hypothetical protein